jgi:hypothetical protein
MKKEKITKLSSLLNVTHIEEVELPDCQIVTALRAVQLKETFYSSLHARADCSG